MNIKAEKAALVKQLQQIEDKELLLAIKHLIAYGSSKKMDAISIDQYNKELDEAESEIDQGKFYSQEEVDKMAKEW